MSAKNEVRQIVASRKRNLKYVAGIDNLRYTALVTHPNMVKERAPGVRVFVVWR